jgi:hypothetical protein
METTEGKVFIGIRVTLSLYMLLFLISIDNSRAWDALSPQLVGSFIGLALAFLIVVNYGKGKNWARIWMLVACYATIILLIRDMTAFADYADRVSRSGLSTWMNIGMVIDGLCLIATLYVLVTVHKSKEKFIALSSPVPKSTEEKLSDLKNMLDRGLITPDDFEKKKGDILKEF